MSDDEKRAKRRIVAVSLLGSAAMMLVVAYLAASGVFEVSGGAQSMVTRVLGGIAVVDVALAAYFFLSNPS